ncbi:response regulator transcription factor [Terrabacter sp. AAH1]
MTAPADGPLRVVLVDDSALFRSGLAALLAACGLEVVAELPDATGLAAAIEQHRPHVVVQDVRLPPDHSDEGIRAALATRAAHADVGVLVLSTYVESTWAQQLFRDGSSGLGYLLKDRVDDVDSLVDGIHAVARGGTVVDPEVVDRLMSTTRRQTSVLDPLTERERDVLALMAEGRSNVGIGERLFLSPRTVEAHIAAIFSKLPLESDDNTTNRRVLAVLAFLRSGAGES